MYYKVLAENGQPYHGGSGEWPLPRGKRPGAWLDVKETIPTRCEACDRYCDGCAFSAVYPEDPLAPARGITIGTALSLLVWLGVAAIIYFGWRA